MTPEEMLAEAVGTLEQWLPGYTSPEDGSPQDRMRLWLSDESSVTVHVESMDLVHDVQDQMYKITVTVELLEETP